MRNRILAGLGVAALATVGVAAPASALSSTTADIWVVHAVPGVTVDVYIEGALAIEDFVPGDVEALVDVPAPATYTVDIVPANDPAPAQGAGLITADAAVVVNTSYTLVAHPEEGGALTISPFVNSLTPVGAGQASVTVRHTADAPAVDVVALPSTNLFSGVTNGQEGVTAVAEGKYDLQVQVDGPAPQAVAIDLPDTVLAAGTHYFIHAFGPGGGPYSAIIFTIGDTPAGVPAGSAGLVAENDGAATGLLVGGAALLALLAAAGVIIARRQAVTAER